MKLKYALIASAVWTVVGLAGAAALLAVIVSQSRPGKEAGERAGRAGGAAGVVVAIGYGAIWLPYAAVGRRRRAAAAKGSMGSGRRRRRDDD